MDPAGRRGLRRRRPARGRAARAARRAARAVSRAESTIGFRRGAIDLDPIAGRGRWTQPVTGRTASSAPSPTAPIADVPIVPVTNFRATPTSTDLTELKSALAGTSARYKAVELVAGEADAILAALGVPRPADGSRLILAAGEAALAADLTKNGKRLAFLRADAVGPEVRALDWGDSALFGVDRVKDLAAWPLSARLPAAAAGAHTTRRRPGRCSPAATSCWTAACTRPCTSRARAPTSRSTAGRPTSPAAARIARRSAGTCRTPSGPATPGRSAP